MTHVDRLPIPQILADKQEDWQSKYEQKLILNPKARPDSSKYGHKDIRDRLNSCSFNKCFYCESKLTGALREVDHYVEVSIDRSLAYKWNNLYLSCSNCNDKLDHNTIPVTEALNPCVDSDEEIQRCLTFDNECISFLPNSTKGRKTIQKFRLDSDLLDLKRGRRLNKLATSAIEIYNKMKKECRTVPTEEEKNAIRRFMQKDQPYSLMCKIYIIKHLSWAL